MTSRPYMSVVIVSFNGAATLARTIESLLAQTYGDEYYEIIVVDDGSTDATPQIAARYPVRYRHQENRGVASARNAGLALARGEIYVSMDDDVIAGPNLLEVLATAYQSGDKVAGVAGVMARLEREDSLVQVYIGATGNGPTARIEQTERLSLVSRFISYLRGCHGRQPAASDDRLEVEEFFGANASFPVAILEAVNGWDAAMTGIEDRDICYRIRRKFPDHRLIAVDEAKLIHDPDLSLPGYMLRGWRRGPINLAFYQRKMMTPPIFPFPVIFVVAVFLAVLARTPWSLLAVLALPQVLYFWWPAEAARRRKVIYLVFPYLQLVEETLVIMGLLRGYFGRSGVSHG